jgi:hypothetical protein
MNTTNNQVTLPPIKHVFKGLFQATTMRDGFKGKFNSTSWIIIKNLIH